MRSSALLIVAAIAEVGCRSQGAARPAERDAEAEAFAERCPAGTSLLPRSKEAYEPLCCARPDGTPHGPSREYHFGETTRKWSVSEGLYAAGRREGEWVTCTPWRGMCVIAATRAYSRGELVEFHTYRATRSEIREPDGTLRVSRFEEPIEIEDAVVDACPEGAAPAETVLTCDPHGMDWNRFQEELDRTDDPPP